MSVGGAQIRAVLLAFALAALDLTGVHATETLSWIGGTEIAIGRGERGPWRMNESRFDYVDDPSVALDDEGVAWVAWVDQARKDVLLQRFLRDGTRLGEPVNVSRSPEIFSWLPRIGLAPDERTLYVVETPTARCWSFKLSGPGQIESANGPYRGEKGTVVVGLGGYQMFDSMAVEANGNVCIATLISGCISVIAPDGRLVEQVPTGDRVTTNIAFGGPELKTAYITLSGKGELIAMDWPRPGLPLNFLNK